MNQIAKISKQNAQRLILDAQGLTKEFSSPLEAIQKLSYVQIDTISVVERAHHHILFTRCKSYQPPQLDQLITDKSIFEYWSHAAAFLPIEDYRFSLFRKAEIKKDNKYWFEKDKKMMRQVLKRIEKEGALQSKDFKNAKDEQGGWYEWKPAKIALNHLFMEGKLMIKERVGFQKVFDLTERILPEDISTVKPTKPEYAEYLIDRAINAHGLMSETEIGYLRKGLKPIIKKQLNFLVKKGSIMKVEIEGQDNIYYSKPCLLDSIKTLGTPNKLHILSPFDNLVIQRKRLQQIFDFDYQIECYVPEPKRIYGYFTLPLLHGQKFIGRLDPKVDRKTGVFYIKSLWFEDGFELDDNFIASFSEEISNFAKFCGCEMISLESVMPNKFKKALKKVL